jgi:uncharacterized membrane protein
MTPSLTPLDSQLITVVLAILAIGLPIVFVLAIRFLWERSLSLGRSRELEKLIWQLHRIASAMEHQMNLSFPAVQPGTEQPGDAVYLRQPVEQKAVPAANAQSVATPAAAPAKQEAAKIQETRTEQTAPQPLPPLEPLEPGETPRHGGVNSMFGF